MNLSVKSPKEPSKIVGWSLISLGVIFGVGVAILVFFIGNDIGGGLGGGIQGGSAFLFIILPIKIIKYGRRRMAERAEALLDSDIFESED